MTQTHAAIAIPARAQVPADPAVHDSPTNPMACMEIWGGNHAIENSFSTPGLDVWVYSKPYGGSEAGGDIHYVSMCAMGNIARFALVDVAGHGSAVSDLSGTLRGLMRKNINTLDQTRFARALNEAFGSDDLREAAKGRFATALLASYWAPSHHLLLVNAGHPHPLHYCLSSKSWGDVTQDAREANAELTHLPSNLPLGIVEPTEYTQFAVHLKKGDLVLLVTDGVAETMNQARQQIGEQGFRALLNSLPADQPETLLRGLLDGLDRFRDGAELGDDLTIILLRHTGAQPKKHSLRERLTVLRKLVFSR